MSSGDRRTFKQLQNLAKKFLRGPAKPQSATAPRTMVFETLEPRVMLDGLTGSAVVLPPAPAPATPVATTEAPTTPTSPASSSTTPTTTTTTTTTATAD